jgi:hypothetical protein
MNHRRGGGPKDGCYGCGDPDHFVTHCPKKNKNFSSKYDSSKRKDKHEYTSGKHKSKGGFDKEVLKKMYLKKAKAQEHAFLTATLTMTPTITALLSPRAMMSPKGSTRMLTVVNKHYKPSI